MTTIEHRTLGAADITVPVLGIGTAAWGDRRYGYGTAYARDDLFAMYRACLAAGANFFDTSESYGGGLSEQFLGEFRRQDGRPIIVATKFTPAKIYDPSTRFSARSVMTTLDGSLKRLGLDAVDLYQLHYPPARRNLDSFLDALAETVKSGKARAIGVSNFDVDLLRYSHEYLARQHVPLAANQIIYSLLNRHPEASGMLAACAELDIAVLAVIPLAEGVLTGQYRVGGKPYPTTVRIVLQLARLHETGASFRRRVLAKPYTLRREKLEPLFDVMDKIADTHNATITQVALNWLIAASPRVIPIPGPQNARQAADNLAALSWQLTQEEFELLSRTEAAIRHSLGLSDTTGPLQPAA